MPEMNTKPTSRVGEYIPISQITTEQYLKETREFIAMMNHDPKFPIAAESGI
jgi:hypothetical protein